MEGVTLAYDGTELLMRTRLKIVKGKIYGLIGKNGCGKSTLLKRMARGDIPGWPTSISVEYVQQEINVSSTKSALELVIDASRKSLFQKHGTPELLIAERAALEDSLEGDESLEIDKMNEMKGKEKERKRYVIEFCWKVNEQIGYFIKLC